MHQHPQHEAEGGEGSCASAICCCQGRPIRVDSTRVPGEFDNATALSVLYAGLPSGWTGAVYASDAPEKEDLRIGIVAIASCSPIFIAHEKGFFKKYGIRSNLSMENGLAAARDKLISGENHASPFKYIQGIGNISSGT